MTETAKEVEYDLGGSENRVVRRAGECDLTKEYELLLLLMENIDIVLSREVLLKKYGGYKGRESRQM